MRDLPEFWSLPLERVLTDLGTDPEGLTAREAAQRLARHGPNRLRDRRRATTLFLLLGQFNSPIILLLIFSAALSLFLHDAVDAAIILFIVLASALLGFWQEHRATRAVEALLATVMVRVTVLRDRRPCEVPLEQIVPGDVVMLCAGDSVPGDCRLLESRDLCLDEAALTGESYPVDKSAGTLPAATPLGQRTNALFLGTHVVSGTGKAVVVRTGLATEFGKVSARLQLRPAETEFERGVRRFGYFLLEVTLVLVLAIFAVNVYLQRPVLDSFLFSLALAVGLTPQLLPAIISVNLAHGARRMAEGRVIVKRLAAIENFGSMDILCADKTGTLTTGVVQLHAARGVEGEPSEKVLFRAYLNASFETGFRNPVDEAVRAHRAFDLSEYQKLDEEPYDFVRKRLSILVAVEGKHLLVTKGALQNVLAVCSHAELVDGTVVDLAAVRDDIERQFREASEQGFRTLGVAYRDMAAASRLEKDCECGMTFLGVLLLGDSLKPDIAGSIDRLRHLGVGLKVITGDNQRVAAQVGRQVGLAVGRLLTGPDLNRMTDAALLRQVNEVELFAEVEPNQKERIIRALQRAGHVVGYLGDGINDASALHAADVSISVDSAVDVAKEAADIVLLEKDLGVLERGVREGRMTFANTLKYVFMATSANFGNMFSMAGVSLLLPFLPLLPKQILLTNLLTDLPEMAIASDQVDPESVEKPRRWDIGFIRRFMLAFGLLSSVFDYLTFGVLVFVLHATPGQFRTGWFMESVVSASLVVFVVRTRRVFFRSLPGRYLLLATLVSILLVLVLPFTPLGVPFEFSPISPLFLLLMGFIVILYLAAAEAVKAVFYRRKHD